MDACSHPINKPPHYIKPTKQVVKLFTGKKILKLCYSKTFYLVLKNISV